MPPKTLLKNPIHFLSLGFGAGLSPYAPGTAGTLVAVPLVWLCSALPLTLYLTLTVGGFLLGVWLCDVTAKALQQEDPSCVVWDEIVGYFITMIAAPQGLLWLLWGFILFRVFDIVKPWPISWCEQKLPGGLGIMVDDVVAGLFAFILLQGMGWIGFAFLA